MTAAANVQLWTHEDDMGMHHAVAVGLARAKAGDWQSGTEADRVRALHGLTLETARLMGALAGTVKPIGTPEEPAVFIDPAPSSSAPEDRRKAATILYRTFQLLEDGKLPPEDFGTHDVAPSDAQGWPVLVFVAVVGVAQAAAIGYVGYQAAQVIDRQLSRRHDLKMLTAEHALTLELVEKHVEREKLAGKPLELDAATKSALNATHARQEDIAKRTLGELPSGLPKVGGALEGFGLGAVVALGAVAWFLMK